MDAPRETDQDIPSKILPQLATRGDIAAAGLGLALGYFGDVWLRYAMGFAHNNNAAIPPGAASVYCSSAAVGLKNSVQALLESRKRKGEAASAKKAQIETLRQKSKHLAELIDGTTFRYRGDPDQYKLKINLDLYERGLIGEDELAKAYGVALTFYQNMMAKTLNV